MAQATVPQDRRTARAQAIVERGTIEPAEGRSGVYRVWDATGSGTVYIATPTQCQCPDFARWQLPCKHSQAAAIMDRELAQYGATWDARSEQARAAAGPRCPDCGSRLECQSYYVGGRGMMAFMVCTRDAQHRALPA